MFSKKFISSCILGKILSFKKRISPKPPSISDLSEMTSIVMFFQYSEM